MDEMIWLVSLLSKIRTFMDSIIHIVVCFSVKNHKLTLISRLNACICMSLGSCFSRITDITFQTITCICKPCMCMHYKQKAMQLALICWHASKLLEKWQHIQASLSNPCGISIVVNLHKISVVNLHLWSN